MVKFEIGELVRYENGMGKIIDTISYEDFEGYIVEILNCLQGQDTGSRIALLSSELTKIK